MVIWNKLRTVALVAAGVAALGACAPAGGGEVVNYDGARGASEIELGVVIDARQVTIQGENDHVGAAAGVVAGAVAGSQIGGGSEEQAIAGVVGGIVGGLVGDEVEKAVDRQPGIQYTIRLQNGQVISVTQGADPMIPVGARVQVLYDRNGETRVQAYNPPYQQNAK